MAQVLHGCTRMTEAVRFAIQRSQESVKALAMRYGVSPAMVQKWRKRSHAGDAVMGPKEVRSSVPTLGEEAAVAAYRWHTLLPLDHCFHALPPSLPHLTRFSLQRCFQRHGMSRLPTAQHRPPPGNTRSSARIFAQWVLE